MDKSPNLRISLNMSKQISYFLECALNIYPNCLFGGGGGGNKALLENSSSASSNVLHDFVFPNSEIILGTIILLRL